MSASLTSPTPKRPACLPVLIAALLTGASCAGVRTPADPGEEDAAVAAYFEVVNRLCAFPRDAERAVVVASVRVRGTSNGRPVRGRVWVGADHRHRSLRVESEAPAEFILTADGTVPAGGEMSDSDATLQLPRQRLVVLRERSRALLSTVLGLPLAAHEFVWAFTGCALLGGGFDTKALGPNSKRVSVVGTADSIDYFLQADATCWSCSSAATTDTPGIGSLPCETTTSRTTGARTPCGWAAPTRS